MIAYYKRVVRKGHMRDFHDAPWKQGRSCMSRATSSLRRAPYTLTHRYASFRGLINTHMPLAIMGMQSNPDAHPVPSRKPAYMCC